MVDRSSLFDADVDLLALQRQFETGGQQPAARVTRIARRGAVTFTNTCDNVTLPADLLADQHRIYQEHQLRFVGIVAAERTVDAECFAR